MEQTEPERVLDEIQARIERLDYKAAVEVLAALGLNEWPSKHQGRAMAPQGVCAEESSGPDRAEQIVSDILGHDDDATFLLAAGNHFAALGDYEPAIEIIRKVCAIDPENHVAHHSLAMVLERDGQYEQALEAHRAALKREPALTASLPGMARCLEKVGHLAEAGEVRSQYLDREPDNAHEWIAMGALQGRLGDLDQADRAFQTAARTDPTSIELYYEWALCAANHGDKQRVAECARTLTRLAPCHWRTVTAAARLAEIEGQTWQGWETCLRAYEMAAESCNEDDWGEAAANYLHYAARNRLGCHAEAFVERLLQEGPLTEGVLAALRELSGRKSHEAVQHVVLIEGDVPAPAGAAPRSDDKAHYRYLRSYGVLAEDNGQARDFVVEFEARCGGRRLRVDAVEIAGNPTDGHLGVCWRSSPPIIYPLPETER